MLLNKYRVYRVCILVLLATASWTAAAYVNAPPPPTGFAATVNGNLSKNMVMQYCVKCDPDDLSEVKVNGFTAVKYTRPNPNECLRIRRSGFIITAPAPQVEARYMFPLNQPEIAYCADWYFGAHYPGLPAH